MNKHILFLAVLAAAGLFPCLAQAAPDKNLKVVMIRHGEKPETGDNLSCQGENRALQLPAVLYQKFKTPDYTYIPKLGLGKATTHARMFQTVSPFAIQYNLTVDSKYGKDDYAKIANKVLEKTGTVLLVWEHKAIPQIAGQLGVKNPPAWAGSDFDSIWVVTYPDGKAVLSIEQEGINPSAECLVEPEKSR